MEIEKSLWLLFDYFCNWINVYVDADAGTYYLVLAVGYLFSFLSGGSLNTEIKLHIWQSIFVDKNSIWGKWETLVNLNEKN